MDDEIDDEGIAYRAKVKQARRDGFNAGNRNAGDDAMPYYEDLNLDQEWALGYRDGQEQRRAEEAQWFAEQMRAQEAERLAEQRRAEETQHRAK